jgi:hypothetical protein
MGEVGWSGQGELTGSVGPGNSIFGKGENLT